MADLLYEDKDLMLDLIGDRLYDLASGDALLTCAVCLELADHSDAIVNAAQVIFDRNAGRIK